MIKNLASSKSAKIILAVVVAIVVVASVALFVLHRQYKTIYADFKQTKGVYAGDSVRMLGVEIGKIKTIESHDGLSRVTMNIKSDVQVPANADAVLVAQSLIAERFIQFTPPYDSGPVLENGATIPVERTAIPIEWDELKTELMSLSKALQPTAEKPKGALGEFIDASDQILDGNGSRARRTLRELSDTMKTLSAGRTDLFSTVTNLQLFVTALSQSEQEIVAFSDHLASVTQSFSDRTAELDAAMKDLDLALADVDRFVKNHGSRLTRNVDKLGQATKVLRDRRSDIEGLFHVSPTALANFYNIYRPYQGTLNGVLAPQWMASPVDFLCGAIQALANNTAQNDAALCASYVAPLVSSMQQNYLDLRLNTPRTPIAEPHQIVQGQKPGTGTSGPGEQPPPKFPAAKGNDVAAGADLTTLLSPGGR